MKFLISALLSVFSVNLFAQYGLQLSYLWPTKNMAYLVKPAVGFELHCKGGEIDKRVKLGGSIGFYSFKPSQAEFNIYATKSSGGVVALLPGKQTVRQYKVYPISFTNEFKVLKEKKLSPFAGIDAVFHLISYADHTKIETLSDITMSGVNYWVFAINPKLGISWELKEKWLLSYSCARNVSLIGTAKEISFWKNSISFSYYPD